MNARRGDRDPTSPAGRPARARRT